VLFIERDIIIRKTNLVPNVAIHRFGALWSFAMHRFHYIGTNKVMKQAQKR
jgi:hypothetical protein